MILLVFLLNLVQPKPCRKKEKKEKKSQRKEKKKRKVPKRKFDF